MAQEVSSCAIFFASYSLADLDAIAVDVEHDFESICAGWIEEADHVNKILEVGVERGIARWHTARSSSRPH